MVSGTLWGVEAVAHGADIAGAMQVGAGTPEPRTPERAPEVVGAIPRLLERGCDFAGTRPEMPRWARGPPTATGWRPWDGKGVGGLPPEKELSATAARYDEGA